MGGRLTMMRVSVEEGNGRKTDHDEGQCAGREWEED